MFTSADKSNTTRVNRQQQTAGTTFFRKAGEDTFFGSTEQPSFFSPAVQTKLTVSSPDDPQEKEADAVADQVMRMPEPVSMPSAREDDTLQKKEEGTVGQVTGVQHPVISRIIQCKGAMVQTKLGTPVQRSYLGDDTGSFDIYPKHLSLYPSDVLQQSGRGPPTSSIPFEQSLSTSKGGGHALPGDTRQFMERRFNADFSGVRIHTGSHAEYLSTQINAQAFAHGNDIYFNSGRYSPNTASGGLLLAHELTHTIQQGASKSHAPGNAATAIARKPIVQRSSGAEQEEAATPDAEQTLQPKNELSSWSVNSGGELAQPKEEERKEEEDKESLSQTPVIQKQYDSEEQVQRSVVDDALAYIDSVTDCISLDLDVAKACALRKAQQVALHIPGYRALRVVLGRDPITSDGVERNGRNFLEAAFDLMPGGLLLHQKLEEQHQLDAAAAWIDEQLARVENLVTGLFNDIERFWNRLGITDLGSPMDVLRNAANIVLGFINRVIDFAVEAASELLAMIKEYLLTKIVDFIKTQTTAYPLLRVILGRDPVTDEVVPTNGTTILNALLELGGEEGIQQRTQMQQTGTFQKAVDFIDEGISLFSRTYDEMVTAFHNIWNIVTINSLMDPIGTFTQIYNQFAGPVGRVLDFVLRVGAEILKFIKEVLMQRLSAWAREQRGYELVTVIIGKDPFTNAVVPRNVENLIRGFMSLMEGGREQFEQLKESGAIDRTVVKVNAAVARLNMTPAYIVQLFVDLWNSFSIHDIANPIAAFQRIIARFGEPIGRLIAFVITIVQIVIEAILIIMKFPFDLINNIIAKAMQAFEMIKRDPVGFLKNLLRAIKQGFIQFFDNILQHLLTGLVGWLTSELRDAGVPAFADTSLRGIISWVLQVLGISMEKIWQKLAAHPRIGPQRVARIRSMINTLEGIWTFIKDVQERGMAAIWDKIKEQLTNLWDTILNAVKSWIMEQIVNRMVTRLLSMLDPTGIMAVVNSTIALYNAIQSFIKYLREMLEIVNSFVEGVVDIASGNITTAANYLERTLARAVPIIIGFLANQVGLSGIGHRVGEMIGRAQEMVDQALTWLVNKAVDTAFNLIDRLMGTQQPDAPAHDPEKQAKIDAGLADIDTEEAKYLSSGKITHEQAQLVAQTVKGNHPVFTSLEAVSGQGTWDYEYAASPKAKKPGPAKALTLPSGDAEADWEKVKAGELMDVSNFDNTIGQQMNLNPDFISDRDSQGRTNRQRGAAGLTAFLSHTDFVELHHTTQSFFSILDEHSHSFHQSVVDDPDYHPMAGDAGYLSWRGEVGWYKGEVRLLGDVYNLIRQRYWRRRF
ncbi:hypothetical protein A4D02_29955 [Niastella koreensis]|uniref:eCIS core domain-containing protein n=2 Tax=Niastella koreensis TaxID=354356 RepID=G8T6M9_NIAKG|nr:DUF4157 domain-containing protein [Niastella koreensis]AEV96874.1 hypothetical protein Niako_0476 [Niastella koreensis GR20-10]OQP49219.1 hypothetical protein A4D02_29955 [Niastella koreensis]